MSVLKRIKYFGAHPRGLLVGGASDLISFYGATPVAQPASANQSAAPTTAITTAMIATTTNHYGFATTTQGNDLVAVVARLVTLVNQMRSDLVALGILKGSA